VAYKDKEGMTYIERTSQENDAFDPLLVNLHDSLSLYRFNPNKDDAVSAIIASVSEILDANLSPSEQGLASDILVGLIKQAEQDIRVSLSEKIALRDNVDSALLNFLAYDSIDVAAPVLLHSSLLSETDLIYIIESKAQDHWQTIAQRKNITDNVTNRLIEKNDHKTACNILKNDTLDLPEDILKKLHVVATENDEVAGAFLDYKALPRAMAVNLYWHVSVAIRQSIASKFNVKDSELDKALEDCVQDFSDTMLQDNKIKPSNMMKNVADQYFESSMITDAFLVSALRRRQGRFFIALFSKRSNLSYNVIWNMMRQIGGQGLAVACRAMNISKENFVSLFLLSRTIVRSSQAVHAEELRMAMRYYDSLTHKMAKEILQDSIAN